MLNNYNSMTEHVTFGPLALTHITKTITDHGQVIATFRFDTGLVWYALFWLALGAAAGYAVHAFGGKKRQKATD